MNQSLLLASEDEGPVPCCSCLLAWSRGVDVKPLNAHGCISVLQCLSVPFPLQEKAVMEKVAV